MCIRDSIDGNTAMGSMLQIGTAGAKAYNAAYLLTPAPVSYTHLKEVPGSYVWNGIIVLIIAVVNLRGLVETCLRFLHRR